MGLNKRLISTASAAAAPSSPLDIATWTGNATAGRQITVSNNPDFVIVKRTSFLSSWLWNYEDGSNIKYLSSNNNFPTSTSTDGVTSFNNGSFTLGAGGLANDSGQSCVGYSLQGGGGYVSNTNGSITSQVSANQAAGFSIVKYTAGGTATVGHGLSQAPELIITKNLDISEQWFVYAEPVGTQKFLGLNTTSAATSNSGVYTSIGSSTFTNNISSTSRTYINLCFHSVDGYQKVGSYSGSGAAGNKQTLGFKPRFLMVKLTDGIGSWWIFDSSRTPNNPRNLTLRADTTDTDYTLDGVDFEDDGFSFNSLYFNESGSNFIYLAIA